MFVVTELETKNNNQADFRCRLREVRVPILQGLRKIPVCRDVICNVSTLRVGFAIN